MTSQAGSTTGVSSQEQPENSTLTGDGVLGGSGAISLDGWGEEEGSVPVGDSVEEGAGFQPSKAEQRRLARSFSKQGPSRGRN